MDFSIVSNEAFREIFQSMSEGILMVDEQGVIEVANQVAEKLFGYETEGLHGLNLELLLPERYRGPHLDFRKSFNANPQPRRMGVGRDLTALRRDGTEFPIEISLSFTHVNGKLFVMAFISDISKRKLAEEGLRRSEEQLIVYATELEHKVQTRTEALNLSVKNLEEEIKERKKAEEEARKSLEKERELNELKSKFVTIASHEFRTPLSTVMSSASLIQQYAAKGDLDKLNKHTQRIKSSVNHLTMILNDFLSLGKLEEGKVEIIKETLNLKAFMAEIAEEVSSFLKTGQDLVIHCSDELTNIHSDAGILRNIMFNLISNASKYSEPNTTIMLGFIGNAQEMNFSITDQGIGIPLEDQKYLFDRFFRASNASNIQGTGLGLNIVRRYAELLNGRISYTTSPGKGSTFTVTIPIG